LREFVASEGCLGKIDSQSITEEGRSSQLEEAGFKAGTQIPMIHKIIVLVITSSVTEDG
jgi:hypothetical protein